MVTRAATPYGEVELAAIVRVNGEVVKLFVVRGDEKLTTADVIAHARRSLTGYKVPRHVEFVASLPKTNVGKVLRRALKEPQEKASEPK